MIYMFYVAIIMKEQIHKMNIIINDDQEWARTFTSYTRLTSINYFNNGCEMHAVSCFWWICIRKWPYPLSLIALIWLLIDEAFCRDLINLNPIFYHSISCHMKEMNRFLPAYPLQWGRKSIIHDQIQNGWSSASNMFVPMNHPHG